MSESRIKRRMVIALFALLAMAAFPAAAAADDAATDKIDSSVAVVVSATGGDQAVPVIVSASGSVDAISAKLPRGAHAVKLPLIDGIAVSLTPDQIEALGQSPDVNQIVADNPVYGFSTDAMSVTNLTIGLGNLQDPNAGGPNGAGVTVAILDSGVAANPDLGSKRLVGWKDFVNGKPQPYDDAGHGTFVAGLIAGDGSASLPVAQGGFATTQLRGVAPAADVVAIKVLNSEGQGRASNLIAGIAWAIAHRDQYGIDVLNISIGGNPVDSVRHDPVAMAVEAAWRQGIVVVCAAGNEGEFGPGGILSPGNDPFVITVGASDTRQTSTLDDDVVASYSSVGPTLYDEFAKPDLVAPGNRLISLRAFGSYIDSAFPENVVPVSDYASFAPAGTVSNYVKLSGTSTSTPLVAGAAALMLGEQPNLSPDDVKLRLMKSADPLASATKSQQGAGLLDVDGALADQTQAHGYALSAYVGDGKSPIKPGDYKKWRSHGWSKYGWTKFKWTKFKWTDYDSEKFKWTKFKWTKFKWTNEAWSDVSEQKFKWTDYEWTKFKWTVLLQGQ